MTVSSSGTPDEPAPSGGTVAATRVADVFLTVATASDEIGVTEIARQLGISKAVVHRVLQSLASRQLVRADAERGVYALGPAAAALGARALRELDLRRLAMPILRELQAETGETATISALVGTARVYLDQVVSLKQVRMTVELGRPYPLNAGASSRAILAVAPPDLRRRVLEAPLPQITETTPTDLARLEALLEETRELGYAASAGERQEGAGSVAAPVFGLDENVIGAISVCGPITRFGEEVVAKLGPQARDAAARLSAQLAGPAATSVGGGA